MASDKDLLQLLTPSMLKEIEDLAAFNLAPNQIALKLKLDKAAFIRLWREKDTVIRDAWERGRLEIHQTKQEALHTEIELGNVTAIQIHDKQTEEAEFEAAKKEIFGLE